jgi:hypothetical protein
VAAAREDHQFAVRLHNEVPCFTISTSQVSGQHGGGQGSPRATTDWQVILDVPTQRPVLRFDDMAEALTALIVNSKPRFTVGVFGPWGSGTTTLLESIARRLATDPYPSICRALVGKGDLSALLGVMSVRSVPAWRQLRSMLLR